MPIIATEPIEEPMAAASEIAERCQRPGDLAIRIRFKGALAGEFRLCFTERTALSLASTLLCLDAKEVAFEHAVPLAGELTNMICGSLLSQVAPTAILTLNSPALIDCMSPLDGGTNMLFDLPEGRVALGLELE